MDEIVDSILKTYGGEPDAESRFKISRYLKTLSSAGTRDRQQLTRYGLAYLEELHKPDRRYTGW
jgi:hypothetical protein